MRFACLLALTTTFFAQAVSAQITDPNMTCEAYIKMAATAGPAIKTGDAAMDKMAADITAKMDTYCKANPKASAADAAMKAAGG
jgi:hypothetical protein